MENASCSGCCTVQYVISQSAAPNVSSTPQSSFSSQVSLLDWKPLINQSSNICFCFLLAGGKSTGNRNFLFYVIYLEEFPGSSVPLIPSAPFNTPKPCLLWGFSHAWGVGGMNFPGAATHKCCQSTWVRCNRRVGTAAWSNCPPWHRKPALEVARNP